MFRIINDRNTDLTEVSANVTFSSIDKNGKRNFQRLPLERDSVSSFPLSWTVVHPINEQSPLKGKTAEDLTGIQAEFLIIITATDIDLSKQVYARNSYLYSEIVFGARFVYIFENSKDGSVVVDPKRIHEIEPAKI
jgi:inward rectifier potassium channel